MMSENISKVLYPSDDIQEGQELRLKQEYFLRLGDDLRCTLPLPQNAYRSRATPRQGRHPVERHPSGPGHPRVDATPHGSTTGWRGTRPGASASGPSPTPTTRFCPKRWRHGRWLFERIFPGTCRSFTRSTTVSWMRCCARFPGDADRLAGCRSSRKTGREASAWRTWPSSAAIR